MCFVFIWEQTATCATYSINWLFLITEMKSVYSAVLTGSLNVVQFKPNLKADRAMNYFLWRLKQKTAICRLCSWCNFCADRYSIYTMIVFSLRPHTAESEDDSTVHYQKANFYLSKRTLFWIVLKIPFIHFNIILPSKLTSDFFLFSWNVPSSNVYIFRIS